MIKLAGDYRDQERSGSIATSIQPLQHSVMQTTIGNDKIAICPRAVSYTHLTLPTIDDV